MWFHLHEVGKVVTLIKAESRMVLTCLLELQILAGVSQWEAQGGDCRQEESAVGYWLPQVLPDQVAGDWQRPSTKATAPVGWPSPWRYALRIPRPVPLPCSFRPKSSNSPGLLHCTLHISLSSAITLAGSSFIKFYSNHPVNVQPSFCRGPEGFLGSHPHLVGLYMRSFPRKSRSVRNKIV